MVSFTKKNDNENIYNYFTAMSIRGRTGLSGSCVLGQDSVSTGLASGSWCHGRATFRTGRSPVGFGPF